jgi:hypothetical protein
MIVTVALNEDDGSGFHMVTLSVVCGDGLLSVTEAEKIELELDGGTASAALALPVAKSLPADGSDSVDGTNGRDGEATDCSLIGTTKNADGRVLAAMATFSVSSQPMIVDGEDPVLVGDETGANLGAED